MNEEMKKQKSQLTANLIANLFVCGIGVLLVLLFAFVVYPYLSGFLFGLVFFILGIITLFVVGMIVIGIKSTIKDPVADELRGKRAVTAILQILVTVIAVLLSAFIVIKSPVCRTGYISGDHSDQKCFHCSQPADGGTLNNKKGKPEMYFCKKHFQEGQNRLEKSKGSDSDTERDSYGNETYDAYWDAKTEVENRLKAPSTAEFCKGYEADVTRNGSTWTVSGWVDAQNSFGATIRSDFSVKITYTARDVYTVDYCHID